MSRAAGTEAALSSPGQATVLQELGREAIAYLTAPPLGLPAGPDPISAARVRVDAESARYGGDPFHIRAVTDRIVAGVPVRDYCDTDTATVPPGVLVYLHGGGFVAGSINAVDAVCRRLASCTGWVVRSIAYRLAPEHPFPAGLHDAEAVIRAALDDARCGNGPRKVAIGGESAGANLAAAAVQRLGSDEVAGDLVAQLLVYPVLARREDGASHRRYGYGYGLTLDRLSQYWDWYLDGADASDPAAAPLLAPELRSPARTLIVVAGCDPVRSDGEAFADRLREAGADVELLVVPGVVPGFFRLAGAFSAAFEVDRSVAELLS